MKTETAMKNTLPGIILALSLAPYTGNLFASTFQDAQEQFQQDNFEEAESILSRLEETPESRRLLGLTLYQLQQIDAAIPLLQQTLAKSQKDFPVIYALANSYMQNDDIQQAQRLLSGIQATGYSEFLLGQTYLKQGKLEPAKKHFTNAKKLDNTLTQDIDLHIARIFYAEGETHKALSLIEKSINYDVDSFEAGALQQYRKTITDHKTGHFNTELAYQLEWDSNVVLRPQSVEIQVDNNGKSDFRNVLFADVLHHYDFNAKSKLNTELHVSGYKHQDLDTYDETRFSLGTSGIFNKKDYTLRLPIEFELGLREPDQQENVATFTPGVTVTNTHGIVSHLFGKYQYSNFKQDAANIEDNLNGHLFAAGFLTLYPLLQNDLVLRLLVQYGYHNTEGDNWKRSELLGLATIQYKPFTRITLEANYQINHSNYSNINNVYLESRDDLVNSASLRGSLEVYKNWTLYGQYTGIIQNSSLNIYDVRKQNLAAGISWHFN